VRTGVSPHSAVHARGTPLHWTRRACIDVTIYVPSAYSESFIIIIIIITVGLSFYCHLVGPVHDDKQCILIRWAYEWKLH